MSTNSATSSRSPIVNWCPHRSSSIALFPSRLSRKFLLCSPIILTPATMIMSLRALPPNQPFSPISEQFPCIVPVGNMRSDRTWSSTSPTCRLRLLQSSIDCSQLMSSVAISLWTSRRRSSSWRWTQWSISWRNAARTCWRRLRRPLRLTGRWCNLLQPIWMDVRCLGR